MKIYFNGKEFSTAADTLSVAELLKINQLPAAGIAVAVNNRIVRKAEWASTMLNADDRVTVITAVCGG